MINLSDEDFEKAANGSKAVFKKSNKPTKKVLIATIETTEEEDVKDSVSEEITSSTESEIFEMPLEIKNNREITESETQRDYMEYKDILTSEQCKGLVPLLTKDEIIEYLIDILRSRFDTPLTNLYEKIEENS